MVAWLLVQPASSLLLGLLAGWLPEQDPSKLNPAAEQASKPSR